MKQKNIKPLILSSLAALSMGTVSVAGTFALFTDKAETTVQVGSGEIKVNAALDGITLYSADASLTSGDLAGVITGDYAGTYYYKQQTGSFYNGGTASITGSTLSVQRMSPGDKVVTNLGFTNDSNIAIKYRLKVSTNAENGNDLLKNLDLKVFGTKYHGLKNLQTKWTEIDAGAAISGSGIEVVLPLETGNEAQAKDAEIKFTLEAVQANAEVTDADKAEYYVDAISTTEYLDTDDIGAMNNLVNEKVMETKLPESEKANTNVKVTVPEGAKIDEDASSLKLYVENLGEDTSGNIQVELDEGIENYDIKVEGLSEDNDEDIVVNVNLGYKPLAIYHTHNNVQTAITDFTYDEPTGITTFKTKHFSDFLFVRRTEVIEVFALNKLEEVRNFVNEGHNLEGVIVRLMNDIDLSGHSWTPLGSAEHPFSGMFDGNNHTISNITVTDMQNYAGFIGYMEGTANASYDSVDDIWVNNALVETNIAESKYTAGVKDLTIDHATCISTKKYAGAVVGFGNNIYMDNVTVSNAQIQTGKCAGGLAGTLNGSIVKDCKTLSTVSVNATSYHAAGLVGAMSYYNHESQYPSPCMPCAIIDSINNAAINTVNAGGNGGSYGGIVATLNAANNTDYLSAIIGCTNNGAITVSDANASGHYHSTIGGIAASAQGLGLLANCTNNGALTLVSSYTNSSPTEGNKNFVGGIVASMGNTGAIEGIYHCQNNGAISATVTSDLNSIGGIAACMSPTASHPAFVDGCVNAGLVSCQNADSESKGNVSNILAEVYSSSGKVIYKNMNFADLATLSEAIPQRIAGLYNAMIEIDESCAVADKTGVLELGLIRRFKGYDGLCSRFTFKTDLLNTSGTIRSAYIDIPNAKLYVAENQTINNTVLDLLADGMGVINHGTFKGGVELFGKNVEVINYGIFLANNGNTISLKGGSGTVTNNGTFGSGYGVQINAAGVYTVTGATPWVSGEGLSMTHEGNVYTVVSSN